MAKRTIVLGAAKYRRADGVWLLGLRGAEVKVHPDDVARFDAVNVLPTAPAVAVGVPITAPEPSKPAPVPVDQGPDDDDGKVDLAKLTKAELVEFAAVAGLELPAGLKLKDDIVAAIQAAEAAEAEKATEKDSDEPAAPAEPTVAPDAGDDAQDNLLAE